ncbi:hypothetical protein ADH66_05040 [Acutalibacter muris]|uniref:Uncharacterized protein n=1 Tax=Acutalibacter muris TaxID=1796620 RepID=A0ABM6L409_9FIRM|nr:hypothetical protein A4V00_19420 [Hungateiclostridiaceae bacterium KB18]ASB40080.1 hypothetical protein ADH66_05040 [Acutalibacter muris]
MQLFKLPVGLVYPHLHLLLGDGFGLHVQFKGLPVILQKGVPNRNLLALLHEYLADGFGGIGIELLHIVSDNIAAGGGLVAPVGV